MTLIPAAGHGLTVPLVIQREGEKTWWRFVEFFTAQIANDNTRDAYLRAVQKFLDFVDLNGLSITTVNPVFIAAYIREHPGSPPTVKQHLAAIRMLFDYFVTGGILNSNPASSVKGPKHIVRTGKTPSLSPEETRRLLDSIDSETAIGARDKALIAVMVFSFARVGAVTRLHYKDYYQMGRRSFVRVTEKGGKFKTIPVHHKAQDLLDAYIEISGIDSGWLFRSTRGKSKSLSDKRLLERNALHMVKRRASHAGLTDLLTCHTFRATGITTYLKNGGTIEKAQYIAGHESPQTTKLYDRTMDDVSLDEIERILI